MLNKQYSSLFGLSPLPLWFFLLASLLMCLQYMFVHAPFLLVYAWLMTLYSLVNDGLCPPSTSLCWFMSPSCYMFCKYTFFLFAFSLLTTCFWLTSTCLWWLKSDFLFADVGSSLPSQLSLFAQAALLSCLGIPTFSLAPCNVCWLLSPSIHFPDPVFLFTNPFLTVYLL